MTTVSRCARDSFYDPETNCLVKLFLTLNWSFLNLFLLCSCQGALPCAVRETGIPSAVRARLLTASLESDTEDCALRIASILFERSLTFRFASLKLFMTTGFIRSIDLGFGVHLSASAFSLERR